MEFLEGMPIPVPRARFITGGLHIKTLESSEGEEVCVHVMRMIYNWRLSRWTGQHCDHQYSMTDLAWCYEGTGYETLMRASVEALAWDGTSENPPKGWIREVHTGRRSHD